MRLGIAALLFGYVLPTGVLVRQMSVHRSELLPEHYDVSGAVTLAGNEARQASAALGLPAQDPLVTSAHFSFAPGKCTFEVAGAQRVVVTNTGGQVSFAPPESSQNVQFAGWLARLGCLPFLFRGDAASTGFEAFFRKAGGDVDDAALTFEAGDVAYVLGAGESGNGKLGLVIQKRGLTPVRAWENEGGTKVEVLFRDYLPTFHDHGFPTVLELRSAGQQIARFAATP